MPTRNKRRLRYKPKAQQRKEGDNMPFYNSKPWRTSSKVYRQEHPLCEVCLNFDQVVIAEVVDHLIPINELGSKLNNENFMAMCHSCHNTKSAKERHQGILIEHSTIVGSGRIPTNREEIFIILSKGRGASNP